MTFILGKIFHQNSWKNGNKIEFLDVKNISLQCLPQAGSSLLADTFGLARNIFSPVLSSFQSAQIWRNRVTLAILKEFI